MILSMLVWHLSDIGMLVGMVVIVIPIAVIIVVRIEKMPKFPKTDRPRLFQRR